MSLVFMKRPCMAPSIRSPENNSLSASVCILTHRCVRGHMEPPPVSDCRPTGAEPDLAGTRPTCSPEWTENTEGTADPQEDLPGGNIPLLRPPRARNQTTGDHHYSIETTEITDLSFSFLNLEPISCSIQDSNCCFLTCIQVSQDTGKMVWLPAPPAPPLEARLHVFSPGRSDRRNLSEQRQRVGGVRVTTVPTS